MTTPATDQSVLPLEDAADILILLLYAPGESGEMAEPIEGITRLQKLVFLFQKHKLEDLVKDIETYDYDPYKLGPYSKDLIRTLEELQSAGIIKTKKLRYTFTDDSDDPGDPDPDIDVPIPGDIREKQVESSRFYLSENLGHRIGEDLWRGLNKKQQQMVTKFKSFFNSISLRQLLIFTYDRHPDYTGQSEIKESLGL